MSQRCLIYGLIDPLTLLVRYVGRSSSGMQRPRTHSKTTVKEPTHCGYWLRQLQRAGLGYEIAVLEEVGSLEELNSAECWWIAYGRGSGWPLTNITAGGDRDYLHTDETKAKMSVSATARQASRELREHMRRTSTGYKHTDETRERMSGRRGPRGPLPEAVKANMRTAAKQRSRGPGGKFV